MPGVQVFGDKNRLITVYGKIKILGEKADSVSFSVNHSQPAFNNFYGIRIMPKATAQVAYANICFAKKFLRFEAYAYGFIANTRFKSNKIGVSADSLSEVNINFTTFSYNDMGIDSIFRSTVTSCFFNDNFYGVNYSNGSIFENCTFQNNSEKGLSGRFGMLTGNVFLANTVGLDYTLFENLLVYLPTLITNNRFEQNVIGYRNNGGLPTGVFSGNYFCSNSLYDIYNNTSFNPNLAGNCWCRPDSVQIRNKIFDLYTDVAKKAGIVKFIPYATSCSQFLPKYAIYGKSISNSSLHQVRLYRSVGGKEVLIRKETVRADFSFKNLEAGIYKILSVALHNDSLANTDFLPTYYFKKGTLASALPLELVAGEGDIHSVDIQMLANVQSATATFANFRIQSDTIQDFVVLLETKNGIKTWKNVLDRDDFSLPLVSGSYKITLINNEGEASSGFYDLKVNKDYFITLLNGVVTLNETLSIPSAENLISTAIQIFPTKLENTLFIRSTIQLKEAKILVYTSLGILFLALNMDGKQAEINTSTWPSGPYIIQVIHDGARVTSILTKD